MDKWGLIWTICWCILKIRWALSIFFFSGQWKFEKNFWSRDHSKANTKLYKVIFSLSIFIQHTGKLLTWNFSYRPKYLDLDEIQRIDGSILTPLYIDHFIGGYWILLIGLTFSVAVFVTEKLYSLKDGTWGALSTYQWLSGHGH